MNATRGNGWLWLWALVAPVPTIVATVALAAFFGTSFHSPDVGSIVGMGVFALVARRAWRMGPRFLTAFACGVGAVLAAAFGIVYYAFTHMGPMG